MKLMIVMIHHHAETGGGSYSMLYEVAGICAIIGAAAIGRVRRVR